MKRACEGGDLLRTITTFRKVGQSDVANIMKQVLSAVKYCHARSIVHRYSYYIKCENKKRDLKLENILFKDRSDHVSTIKVIDFGRSKVLKSSRKLNELAGSVFSMKK